MEKKIETTTSARKLFVGGNWKSNGTIKFVKEHIADVINKLVIDPAKLEVMVAPTYIHLPLAKELLKPNIILAAQNVSPKRAGAFTGEIASEHLKDMGIGWVIIGHSERRSLFVESDVLVAEKVVEAQKDGLSSVLCIGEKLEEREAGKTWDVCKRQLDAVLSKHVNWDSIVIAYEPVWAIGTGKVATPAQAQEVHALIRKWLSESISPAAAAKTRVIYGGSVTDTNAGELIKQLDVDGFLVGGASLKPAFTQIVNACNTK
jgi:triosephosphate isomerase